METITVGDLTLSANAENISVRLSQGGQTAETTLGARDAAIAGKFLAKNRSGEQRTGFRVPIEALLNDIEELSVTVVYQGTIYDAVPLDLSLTGTLLKVPGIAVQPQAPVTLRLIVEDYLAKLRATVVRTDGELVALHYEDSLRNGQLNPPAALGPIFSLLERLYLQQRG